MQEVVFPLTRLQQGLWIESQLHPDNTSYNTAVQVRMEGPLDIRRFEQACSEVTDFFDTLKVFFRQGETGPEQILKSELQFKLRLIDIAEGATEESAAAAKKAKELLAQQLATPVNLREFPIMRGLLVQTASQVFYFIGMVPHIVSDGRSAVLYLEALSVAYNQGRAGLEKNYGPTRKSWSDFYAEKAGDSDPAFLAEAKHYWQEQLKGATHHFDYSYGKNAQSELTNKGRRVYFDLEKTLADALKKMARQNRTTLFNLLACAFAVFVYKYFGLKDILIGYPVNVRPRGYQHFFGFFVNIVPIRIQLKAELSFNELLTAVTAQRKQDKKFQQYPSLDIVAAIREQQPGFDGRLFNLSMAQTVSRLFDLQLDEIETTPIETEYFDVNDEFSLSYELINEGIGLWFEYREALFSEAFVIRAMSHIESILRTIVSSPEQSLASISLYQFRQNLSNLLAATPAHSKGASLETDYLSLAKRMAKAVDEFQSLTAISDRHGRLSFSALDKVANQWANYLIEQGVRPGDKIALLLSPGRKRIIAMLAALKVGACYVPMAHHMPSVRVSNILEQCRPSLLLIDDKHRASEAMPLSAGLNVCAMSTSIVEQFSDEFSIAEIPAKNPAYILFTSGSSGEPKGVVVSHQALSDRLNGMSQFLSLTPGKLTLQATDYSFDVSVMEIFWSLIQGVGLALVENVKQLNQPQLIQPGDIVKQLQTQPISYCFMVPSLLKALLSLQEETLFQSVEKMILAGEALSPALVSQFLQKANSELYNLYGPTETCVYVSGCLIDHSCVDAITIGKPLPGVTYHIMADDGSLLPIGVAGELVISGVGLADGYLNQPSLTSEKFIQFKDYSGHIRQGYLSGDLARINERGEAEILGRKDAQVKVRGFRIELEEIESVLVKYLNSDLPLDWMAFISEENSPAIFVLVSCLENATSSTKDSIIEQAKSILKQRLPGYMQPSGWFFAEAIPRLSSGKPDRRAAQSLIQTNRYSKQEAIQPAVTDYQKLVANTWSQLLRIEAEKIDIHTSFFELGGDSLMAIQFVSMMEQKGYLLATDALFNSPTIDAVGSQLQSARLAAQSSPESAVETVSGVYGLLPRQAKFFADDFTNPHHWNRTFSFESNETIDFNSLKLSVIALLYWHDNLRSEMLLSESGEWRQRINNAIDVDEVVLKIPLHANRTELTIEQEIRQIVNQQHQKLRIDKAPLLKVVWIPLENSPDRLFLLIHHLQIDMVSSRILFEDWVKLYRAAEQGMLSKIEMDNPCSQKFAQSLSTLLSGKTTSVKAYTEMLHQPVTEDRLRQAVRYWGKMPVSLQPKWQEKSRSVNQEGDALVSELVIAPGITQRLLREIAPASGIAFQHLLASTVFFAICQQGGGSDLVYATCSHARQEEGVNLSRTVGWINSVYPVYLKSEQLKRQTDCLDALTFIREVDAQMQEIPKHTGDYNRLRYLLNESAIVKAKYPQYFFNYVGQIDALIPEGLPFQPLPEFPGIAACAAENHLCYWLYIEAAIVNDSLLFRTTYSDKLFTKSEINQLENDLTAFIDNLLMI